MHRRRAGAIAVVDAYPIVREGLTRLIEAQAGLELVGAVGTAAEARRVVERETPDLVLLGLNLMDADALDLIGELTEPKRREAPRVLALSVYDEEFMAEPCLRRGATGYLRKNAEVDEFLDAIHAILGGEVYLSERARTQILTRISDGRKADRTSPLGHLTDRELQVFRLLGEGRTTREIADLLGLSVKTIQTHRTKIMKRLGLENATRLLHRAVEWSCKERVAGEGSP